jgi:hypothetical protein
VASFGRLASRFFSSVRRKTRTVVRRDLCGVQSSLESGECSQMGHEEGSVEWPMQPVSRSPGVWKDGYNVQPSQIACSQHGSLNALTASLLQMAQRSFAGMSSVDRELCSGQPSRRHIFRRIATHLMISAWAGVMTMVAAMTG